MASFFTERILAFAMMAVGSVWCLALLSHSQAAGAAFRQPGEKESLPPNAPGGPNIAERTAHTNLDARCPRPAAPESLLPRRRAGRESAPQKHRRSGSLSIRAKKRSSTRSERRRTSHARRREGKVVTGPALLRFLSRRLRHRRRWCPVLRVAPCGAGRCAPDHGRPGRKSASREWPAGARVRSCCR